MNDTLKRIAPEEWERYLALIADGSDFYEEQLRAADALIAKLVAAVEERTAERDDARKRATWSEETVVMRADQLPRIKELERQIHVQVEDRANAEERANQSSKDARSQRNRADVERAAKFKCWDFIRDHGLGAEFHEETGFGFASGAARDHEEEK